MYKTLLRPILFLFKAETAHQLTFLMLRVASGFPIFKKILDSRYRIKDNRLKRKLLGLEFDNPVGLAAGFDKDARLINTWPSLGFGFIEIGTITPKPQPGNEKPRLFRLKEDSAIINRMGFNNDGMLGAQKRLKKYNGKVVIGGNIGKNKSTANEDAADDYMLSFKALHHHVDYFVVNVSSPNTPGLRELQDKKPLLKILGSLREESKRHSEEKPILLKIAPDLSEGQLLEVCDIIKSTGIQGVIATNTTISRDGLKTEKKEVKSIGAGGLSGKPLSSRSTEVIHLLRKSLGKDYVIIGVGGIMNENDAIEKLQAGADLIQIYTGYIYEGPSLVRRINKKLLETLN